MNLEFSERFILAGPDVNLVSCSKLCMVSAFAPELTRAVALAQWIKPKRWKPTPEEEERMRQ